METWEVWVCRFCVTGTSIFERPRWEWWRRAQEPRSPSHVCPQACCAHYALLFPDHAHVLPRAVHPPADGAVLSVHGPHLQRLLFQVRQPVRLCVERVCHVQLQPHSSGAPENGALEVSVVLPRGVRGGQSVLPSPPGLTGSRRSAFFTVTASSGTAGSCSWTPASPECSEAPTLWASILWVHSPRPHHLGFLWCYLVVTVMGFPD